MIHHKVKLRELFIIELLVIVLFAIVGITIVRGRSSVSIPVDAWTSSYASFEDGSLLMNETKLAAGPEWQEFDKNTFQYLTDGEVVAFSSPVVALPKGDYTLTLNYGSSVPTAAGITVDEVCKPNITTGRLRISANQNVLVYHISAKQQITGFRVDVFYQNEGELYLTGASIDPNANGVKRGLFIILLISLIVDFCFIYRKWFMKHQTRVMMMTLAVILASLPLATPSIIYGHDILFHLNRIDGIAQELMQHHFPVRNYPNWMDGYGYPTSIYYGDIMLYFPAIMRLMGFTLIAAYKSYIVLVNVLTVVISYVCFRRIFRDYKIAVVTACAYLLSTYRLVDIYTRAAVGEYTAMIFLPLVAMAMYRIYTDVDTNWKQYRYNALYLALGMTGLICTHVLSTEMAVVTLVIVALLLARRTFTRRCLRVIGTAVAGTIVFSAWYMVPMVYHFLFVPTRLNSGNVMKVFAAEESVSTIDGLSNYFPLIQSRGAYLGQLFNVFGYPFGFGSAEVYERSAFTPGLVLMGALIVALFYWFKGKANQEMKVFTVISVILLWMSTNLFPWDFLGLHVSRLFTTFEMPMRFLSFANVGLSLLFGATMLQVKKNKNMPRVFADPDEDTDWEETLKRLNNRRFRNMMMAALVGCVFTSLLFVRDAMHYDFTISVYDSAELNTVKGNAFVCLRDGSIVAFPIPMEKSENVTSYEILSKVGDTVRAHIETSGEAYVEVPKLRYPGYVAYDENGDRLKLKDGTNNVVRVIIPQAYSGDIVVTWKEPVSWRIAELITVLGLLFYWITWLRRPSAYRSFGK